MGACGAVFQGGIPSDSTHLSRLWSLAECRENSPFAFYLEWREANPRGHNIQVGWSWTFSAQWGRMMNVWEDAN